MKTLSMDTFDHLRKLKVGAHRILVIRIFVVMLVVSLNFAWSAGSLTAQYIVESNTRHPVDLPWVPEAKQWNPRTLQEIVTEKENIQEKREASIKPPAIATPSTIMPTWQPSDFQPLFEQPFTGPIPSSSVPIPSSSMHGVMVPSEPTPVPASTVSVPIQIPWSLLRPARKSVSFPIKAAIFKELPFQPFLIILLSIRKPTMVSTSFRRRGRG